MYLQICRAWTRTEEAIFFLTLDQFLQSAPEKSFLFLVLQAFFFFLITIQSYLMTVWPDTG